MTSEIITEILKAVISILSVVVTAVILPALTKWISSKTHNQKINTMLTEVSEATAVTVQMLEQTMVANLKEEGKWNSDSQKELCTTAISSIIDSLSSSTKELLDSSDIEIEEYIRKYVESYINSKK